MNWRYGVLGLLIVFLFVGGPDNYSHRLLKEIWDTGHIVLFAGLIWLFLLMPLLKNRRWIELFLFTTVFSLLLGFAIEFLQILVGRDFDVKDVLNDVLGGYLGLLIFTALQSQRHIAISIFMYFSMLSIIVFSLKPLTITMMDEFRMNADFPMLASFEAPYELSRWENNLSSAYAVKKHARHESKSMRIDFDAGKYPGVTLKYFPRDWQDFSLITFSVFNSGNENILMELKIHDRQHALKGRKYTDRFNRKFKLKQGWNDLVVLMEEVESAPRGREMNLSEITNFSLFLHDLKKPATLYLDGLRLSRNH